MKNIYLCGAKRTPIGSFQGNFADVPATKLGADALSAVLNDTRVEPNKINSVIMGCVLTAGTGQAPARQTALKAGLPNSVQAMAINKVCSSGLKAVMLAANYVALDQFEAVLAGGMESMSSAPYYLSKLRSGARMGHTVAEDSIIRDGLWDVYNNYHMGNAAELCAKKFQLSRNAQDEYALESYRRANHAIESGLFKEEIIGVKVVSGKQEREVLSDEEPGNLKVDKVPQLKPAFDKEGTITAANASKISDGAAAVLVCSEKFLREEKLTPLARIVAQGWAAQEPEWFTTAPIAAVHNVLKNAALKVSDIDLFEINEAFSAVALACSAGLEIDRKKVNVHGGAVALGHPIGASGARILTTLLYALRHYRKKRGVCAICNGGGEATALLVEAL